MASLVAGGRFTYLGRLVRPEEGVAYTRFSVELKTENLELQPFNNRTVIVRASSFNHERRRMRHWPHHLLEGTPRYGEWTGVSLVVPWTPEISLMRLEIVNVGKAGTLKVRRVKIESLVDAPWHGSAEWALIVAWIALSGFTAVVVAQRLRPLRFGLAIAATGVALLAAAVLPQPIFDRLAEPFEEPLIAIVRASSHILPQRVPREEARPAPQPPPQAEAAAPAPREEGRPATPSASPSSSGPPAPVPRASDTPAGPAMTSADAMEVARDGASWLRRQVEGNTLHAAGFGFLSLLSIGLARLPFLRVVLAVAAMAAATEAVQLFTITRDAALNDLVVDATGALAGVLAGFALRRLLSGIRSSARRGSRPAG